MIAARRGAGESAILPRKKSCAVGVERNLLPVGRDNDQIQRAADTTECMQGIKKRAAPKEPPAGFATPHTPVERRRAPLCGVADQGYATADKVGRGGAVALI